MGGGVLPEAFGPHPKQGRAEIHIVVAGCSTAEKLFAARFKISKYQNIKISKYQKQGCRTFKLSNPPFLPH
jgi:hypothetical protein